MNWGVTTAKKPRRKPAAKTARGPAAPSPPLAPAPAPAKAPRPRKGGPPTTTPAATPARGRSDDDEGPARSNPLGLEIDAEVLEFIDALDRFKKDHGRPFPSWSEVLHVLRQLGYQKLPLG
jgi:hypothetical protein